MERLEEIEKVWEESAWDDLHGRARADVHWLVQEVKRLTTEEPAKPDFPEREIDPENISGPFFGAHSNVINVGGTCYELREDPEDGYRSALDGVYLVANPGGFFDQPVDQVTVVNADDGDFHGYNVVGADGHIWCTFGTSNTDDYYPMFTFEYYPKERVWY